MSNSKYDLDAWSKQCDALVKAVLDTINLSLIFGKKPASKTAE